MKEKFNVFMQGRYGVDTLTIVLMISCIIAFLLDVFIAGTMVGIIGYVLWFLASFRMFSRQLYKRNQENEKFKQIIAPITRMKTVHEKRKQDPTHTYYRCPTCNQIVRLPKGRGKVVITCPTCKHQFEKRT